jgi:hypothetical protein
MLTLRCRRRTCRSQLRRGRRGSLQVRISVSVALTGEQFKLLLFHQSALLLVAAPRTGVVVVVLSWGIDAAVLSRIVV